MSQKILTLVPFICLCCLLVTCATFPGCGGTGREEKSNSKSIAKTEGARTTYKTKKIMAQKIRDEVRAIGTVRAYQEVQISPEISGKIKTIYFNVGDRVKQGDILE